MSERRNQRQAGFTLIELMVVIVILGALATVILPNVRRALFGGTRAAVEMQLKSFRDSIEQYRIEKRTLPPTLQDLTQNDPKTGEPWLDKVPQDPWGGEYAYRQDGKRDYVIESYGEDRQPGTDDDIVMHSREGIK